MERGLLNVMIFVLISHSLLVSQNLLFTLSGGGQINKSSFHHHCVQLAMSSAGSNTFVEHGDEIQVDESLVSNRSDSLPETTGNDKIFRS